MVMHQPSPASASNTVPAIALCLAGYLVLLTLATLGFSWDDSLPTYLATTVLDPTYFFPEPVERAAYFLALIFFPVAGWFATLRPWLALRPVWVAIVISAGVVALVVWYISQLDRQKFVFDVRLYPVLPGIAVGLMISLALRYLSKPLARTLVDLACVTLIVIVVLSSLLGAKSGASLSNHFQVIASPVVQVLSGRTLLVDATSQYGLYPHFLEPVLHLFGASVVSLSTTLAVLTGFSFLLIFLCLRQWITHSAVLLTTWFSLVFLHFFLGKLHTLHHYTNFLDPYFQYWPVRFVFPAIALFAIAKAPSGRRAAAVTALLALGVRSHLDSGSAAYSAWATFLVFRPDHMAAALKVILGTVVVLFAAVLLCGVLLYLRSGNWPDVAAAAASAELFFGAGYLMSPLPFFHVWQAVALVYVAALIIALQYWQREPSRNAHLAGLAALGALLFSYYVGRSHELLLLSAMYPAIMILGIYIDNRLAQFTFRHVESALISLVLLTGLTATGTMILELPRIAAVTTAQLSTVNDVPDHPAYLFIQQYANKDEPLLILANESPLLHLATKTQPASADDYYGMVFKRQFDQITQTIEAGGVNQAVVAFSFMQVTPRSHYDARIAVVTALEQSGLMVVASTADGRYQFLQRPPVRVR